MKQELRVEKEDEGRRLDSFLREKLPTYSRSYFANLAKTNQVTINGKNEKPSYIVKTGDLIVISLIETGVPSEIKPEDIKLNIIYENQDVIVINKQPGLVVHPAVGNYKGTLVNALVNYLPKLKNVVRYASKNISLIRPCIVQRLDKDTSGVMIVAKNKEALTYLSEQIKKRAVTKKYLALCYGWPKEDEKMLVNYLGRDPKNRLRYTDVGKEKGREAISYYRVINYFTFKEDEKASLIEFDIKTGRTHQIRIQSKLLKCPVLGDRLYGHKESIKMSKLLNIERQLLHSSSLSLILPQKEEKTFTAPLPDDFVAVIGRLTKLS